jgi:hypothetical protein
MSVCISASVSVIVSKSVKLGTWIRSLLVFVSSVRCGDTWMTHLNVSIVSRFGADGLSGSCNLLHEPRNCVKKPFN